MYAAYDPRHQHEAQWLCDLGLSHRITSAVFPGRNESPARHVKDLYGSYLRFDDHGEPREEEDIDLAVDVFEGHHPHIEARFFNPPNFGHVPRLIRTHRTGRTLVVFDLSHVLIAGRGHHYNHREGERGVTWPVVRALRDRHDLLLLTSRYHKLFYSRKDLATECNTLLGEKTFTVRGGVIRDKKGSPYSSRTLAEFAVDASEDDRPPAIYRIFERQFGLRHISEYTVLGQEHAPFGMFYQDGKIFGAAKKGPALTDLLAYGDLHYQTIVIVEDNLRHVASLAHAIVKHFQGRLTGTGMSSRQFRLLVMHYRVEG